jgi:hypothetical protein
MTSFCWDLLPPSDPVEGREYDSFGDYRIIEFKSRYLCYAGDREVHDFSYEWDAQEWLEKIKNEIEAELQEECTDTL